MRSTVGSTWTEPDLKKKKKKGSSFTVGPISTMAICCPSWMDSRMPSVSSTTISGGAGDLRNSVRPEDVTLTSEVNDLDRVRQHFGLDAPVLLGHSWGAVLALEYALRYLTHVSHLILMNPGPVSASDVAVMRETYLKKLGADMDRQGDLVASAAYRGGDPEAVAAAIESISSTALRRPEDYETLMARMKARFTSQGREGILKARAVEDQLMRDTWDAAGYSRVPELRSLPVPTLVIIGDHDFIPVEIATHVARAMPKARARHAKGLRAFHISFRIKALPR